jgi:hypothetical protein
VRLLPPASASAGQAPPAEGWQRAGCCCCTAPRKTCCSAASLVRSNVQVDVQLATRKWDWGSVTGSGS